MLTKEALAALAVEEGPAGDAARTLLLVHKELDRHDGDKKIYSLTTIDRLKGIVREGKTYEDTKKKHE